MRLKPILNHSLLVGLLATGGLLSESLAMADASVVKHPPFTPAAKPQAAVPTTEDKANSAAAAALSSNRNQCTQASGNLYEKSVAIMDFPRAEANSAKAGDLHQVEYRLPELLAQSLKEHHGAITPIHLQSGLPAPAASSNLLLAAQVQQLARTNRTQFILSGEVLDMSMAHPRRTYNPALYTRVINDIHDTLHVKTFLDKRDRLFSFQLSLRDGFTGQLLFQKRYNTYGIWNISNSTVGFATPLFWQSDYGQQVQGLVSKASDEVAAALRCQPYIARADMSAGQQQVVLHSGANNGLRAGDKLELYQLIQQPITGEYMLYDTRLVNRNALVEIREVYPSHSVAVVQTDNLLNGQYLAVAP